MKKNLDETSNFHNTLYLQSSNSIPYRFPEGVDSYRVGGYNENKEWVNERWAFDFNGTDDKIFWYYDIVEREKELEKRDNRNIIMGAIIGFIISLLISLLVLKISSMNTTQKIEDSEKNIISNIESNKCKIEHSIRNEQNSNESDIELQKDNFIGSKTSRKKKYHYSTCRSIRKIRTKNKIEFTSSEDAKLKGYTPCENCNPH